MKTAWTAYNEIRLVTEWILKPELHSCTPVYGNEDACLKHEWGDLHVVSSVKILEFSQQAKHKIFFTSIKVDSLV